VEVETASPPEVFWSRSGEVNEDIGPILERWPYGEGPNVRKIVGRDGREKVQIRVVLEGFHGLLQFECDGRPDGKRPYGREFALDYFEDMKRTQEKAPGYPKKFELSREQAAELFEESMMTYQRYVILLQMNDYPRVIRDTARNMKLFRFVHENASHPEDRDRLEKWWAYILRIHHTARAMLRLENGDYDGAARIVEQARSALRKLPPQDDEVFQVEMKRSMKALDELEKLIENRRPPTELELLEREKAEAIAAEDYERAAELRDRILELQKRLDPSG